MALSALAMVTLARDQPLDALDYAERGIAAAARGGMTSSPSRLHLARAEALHALGRTADARAAIREARDRVSRIAATLDGHPDLRRSYLTNILANARTLELAKEWLGEEAAG